MVSSEEMVQGVERRLQLASKKVSYATGARRSCCRLILGSLSQTERAFRFSMFFVPDQLRKNYSETEVRGSAGNKQVR